MAAATTPNPPNPLLATPLRQAGFYVLLFSMAGVNLPHMPDVAARSGHYGATAGCHPGSAAAVTVVKRPVKRTVGRPVHALPHADGLAGCCSLPLLCVDGPQR